MGHSDKTYEKGKYSFKIDGGDYGTTKGKRDVLSLALIIVETS